MAKSHESCLCTGVYRSNCGCNAELFRRKDELFPSCWSCHLDVEWNLTEDLRILDEFPNATRAKPE